jgi:hypothetical protein
MKTLISFLVILSVGSAQAQMNQAEAVDNINGDYVRVDAGIRHDICPETLKVDLEYSAASNSVSAVTLEVGREYYVDRGSRKLRFSVESNGRESVVELSRRYSVPNDDYSSTLMNQVSSVTKLSLLQGSDTLRANFSGSHWTVLASDCTSSSLYKKRNYEKSCIYRKR